MLRRSRQHPDAIARMELVKSIRHYSRCSRVTTAKKCTKKRDARAKLLFCLFNPIAFSPFSLPSPSPLLKLPKEASAEERGWFPYNRPHRPNRPKFPKLKSLVSRRLYGTEPGLINCPQIYSAPLNMKLVYYLPSIRRVDWT